MATGTLVRRSSSGTSASTVNASEAGADGAVRSRKPGPEGAPVDEAGSAAAVAGLITISPAFAAPSIVTTCVAAGPVTISSRCDPPTRK